jgi:tripartite-type tricarboxylate transporter receptor subunit TctC
MNSLQRSFSRTAVLATFCLGLLSSPWVFAQTSKGNSQQLGNYPSRAIKVLVGYSPGGAVDIVARALSQSMSSSMGVPIVVENKPGAGTNIAVKAAIAAEPDGYTLMLAANALAANMALYQPSPFDAERDLSVVALVGQIPVVIAASTLQDSAGQSAPASMSQLLERAKRAPKTLNYASPGNGSTPHLAMEIFAKAAGVELVHVPYKGGAQAITDVLGGQVQLLAMNALEVLPHVKSGKLRILAVLSAKRSSIFPDAMTLSEQGFPGFEASVWYGLVAPQATPKAVLAYLHDEVQKALQSAEVKEKMSSVGGEVTLASQEQFADLLHKERVRYDRLIKQAQIKPD